VEWVETTGRSVEAALDAALDQLGVDEEEAEYEVLQEARTGLLGRRDARIRARVRPVSREKPGERRRRSRREPGRDGGGRRGGGTRGARPAASVAVAAEDEDRGEGTEERTGPPARRRRRRGGRGRGGGGGSGGSSNGSRSGNGRGDVRSRPGDGTQEDSVSEESVSVEEQAEAAAEFAQGLVTAFGVDAEVGIQREDDDVVIVNIDGPDLGLLVGPKGVTLQAIEELVRTVVQRRTEGHGARIHVDVGGYRAKRRAALERFALGVAEEVQTTGEERELEPMSASDRKVVHDAITPLEGVTTTSEGEDPRRRVVIRPG
jgi:spoIIIJ-associated protein